MITSSLLLHFCSIECKTDDDDDDNVIILFIDFDYNIHCLKRLIAFGWYIHNYTLYFTRKLYLESIVNIENISFRST